jgi:hypothetical protein
MVTGTTSDEQKPPTSPDHRQIGLQSSQSDSPAVKVDSTTHGVDNRLGLFVDLLLHEVVELSLHDLGKFYLEGLDSSNGRESIVLSKSVDMKLCCNVAGVRAVRNDTVVPHELIEPCSPPSLM